MFHQAAHGDEIREPGRVVDMRVRKQQRAPPFRTGRTATDVEQDIEGRNLEARLDPTDRQRADRISGERQLHPSLLAWSRLSCEVGPMSEHNMGLIDPEKMGAL